MNYLVLSRIWVKKRKHLGGTLLPKLSPTPGERGALYKGIRIPESVKFLLVESRIREHIYAGSGILGFESGIQLKESGIPLTIEI